MSYRLLIAILADTGAVDRTLEAFAAAGLPGATVIDGRGMREHRSSALSLFAGFRTAFAAVGHSQVVLALIETERAAEALATCRTAAELDQPGTGLAFLIEVTAAVGVALRDEAVG